MKMKHRLALLFIGLCTSLTAQIKIGDNPEIIDPASVLELESSNRVLVITRISTAEMNAISPSPGAMVYNTDENCVFYYNGIEWLNLCDALGLDITADAIVNPSPTIILTENGSQTNIEVGMITGANIVDFSISGIDIGSNSIDSEQLAPDSVGELELQENSVTRSQIDESDVTVSFFLNDAGYLTTTEVKALGKIDGTGSIIKATDGVTANRLGTGNYVVDVTDLVQDADYVIQLTVLAPGASIAVVNQTASNFEVQISNLLSGAPLDAPWYFTILDL